MIVTIAGIPSSAGALYPGTDEAPRAIREAGLIESLQQAGIKIHDVGDLLLPPYLPKHNIAPVRNWPAPRLVWESLAGYADVLFEQQGFTLLIGGDCSVVVGSVECLTRRYGENVHVISVDAHIDAVVPRSSRCLGAAASGIWFLTQENVFWTKPPSFKVDNVTVVGCQSVPEEHQHIPHVTLEELRKKGIQESAQQLLSAIPEESNILIHFDVDVIGKDEMPAAYAPMDVGLACSEVSLLLSAFMEDTRVKGLELTEFSAFRDTNQACAKRMVDLLTGIFSAKK